VVVMGEMCRVPGIQVKKLLMRCSRVVGAFKVPGSVRHELFRLLSKHIPCDVYTGAPVNTCMASGGEVSRGALRPVER
jgi:hypothetical protein